MFEEQLDELVQKHLEDGTTTDSIVSALELKLTQLKEEANG